MINTPIYHVHGVKTGRKSVPYSINQMIYEKQFIQPTLLSHSIASYVKSSKSESCFLMMIQRKSNIFSDRTSIDKMNDANKELEIGLESFYY